MTTRTDIHRPSAIVPEDYEFVAFEYLPRTGDVLGDSLVIAGERATIRAHMAATGGTYANHEHGGNCMVCGSVNAVYSALFYHAKTNTYVRTGLDCAETLNAGDIPAFKRKVAKALEAAKGKRKAAAVLAEAGLTKAWEFYTAATPEGPAGDAVLTIKDIVGKLVKYGSVSDKALNFVRVLVERAEKADERAAAREAEKAAAAPVPVTEGRVKVEGTVLTKKVVEGPYGRAVKMLVKHDDGWKVWGTKPSGFEVEIGDKVAFEATVERSKDDEKFGFFSRPTKAAHLTA